MKIRTFQIEGPLLVEPRRVHDLRGFSSTVYAAQEFASQGVETRFVEDHVVLSTASGTVRGLHFQTPPHAQARLIRVIRGAIFAAAVDLRAESTCYGRSVSAELTAESGLQLYIPEGFAHGYATLRPLTEISCRTSSPRAPGHEAGIFWDDPALRIYWPVTSEEAVMSPEDKALPLLRDCKTALASTAPSSGVAA